MSTPYPFESNEDNDPLEEEGTPKNQRRFNQLSWLLECGMCTSATPIKGKFYICANEFSNKTKGRRKNKQVDFICEVMEYFRDLAKNSQQMWDDESEVSEKRDKIIRSICLNQIRVATFGRVMVSSDVFKTVIKSAHLTRFKFGL
jgi:hypothetical protein